MAQSLIVARAFAAAFLVTVSGTAHADALDKLVAQCEEIDLRMRQINGQLRFETTDAKLAAVQAAIERVRAINNETLAIEAKAGCFNQTTRCAAALRPARDREFEARNLANSLLGYADIETQGHQKSSARTERVLRQFERMLPVVSKANRDDKLLRADLAAKRGLYDSLDCFEAWRRNRERGVQANRSAPAPTPAAPTATATPTVDDPISAADLVGTWSASGYNCDGPQGEETVEITRSAAGGLVATKIVGDACVRSGEITWRGTLYGDTIRGELRVGEPNASAQSGSWVTVSWKVISRDEIQGSGVLLRRTSL